MMTIAQQHAAMDDMAVHGCLDKAQADLKKARNKVANYFDLCRAGIAVYESKARCLLELRDALKLVEFYGQSVDWSGEAQAVLHEAQGVGADEKQIAAAACAVSTAYCHAAEEQALAGFRLDLKTSEVVA